jgi:hypothetical protein
MHLLIISPPYFLSLHLYMGVLQVRVFFFVSLTWVVDVIPVIDKETHKNKGEKTETDTSLRPLLFCAS